MKTITKYAKENRKKPTRAEKELRRLLLRHKIPFRAQRMYDFYIVDFLVIDKRLLLEVDGSSHVDKETYDAKRDAYLKSKGFIVSHFQNETVFNNPEVIIKYINALPDIPRLHGKDVFQLYGKAKY